MSRWSKNSKHLSLCTGQGLWWAVLVLSLSASAWACGHTAEDADDKEQVLAQVYNKSLVLSEVQGLLSDFDSPQDSINQLRTFVEHWVAEAILMHEAEKHVRPDMNLDQLVRDYRSSLVLDNYEKQLIRTELDTVVTDADVKSYFDAHREQFLLRSDIVRYTLIKLPRTVTGLDTFLNWWNRDSLIWTPVISTYLKQKDAWVHRQTDKWMPADGMRQMLPVAGRHRIRRPGKYTMENNDYLYFLNLLAYYQKGQPPPIDYVRDQVEKIILHKRKIELIERKKKMLYNREINSENVKIFTH